MNKSASSEDNSGLLLKVIDEHEIDKAIKLIRDVGRFKHVVYHLKFRTNKSTDLPFHQSTYPAEWIGRYIKEQYSEIDPILLDGFSQKEIFLWSKLKSNSQKEIEFFKDAEKYGIGRNGATVPLIDKAKRQAIFCITSDMDEKQWAEKIERERDILTEIGNVLHRKAMRLLYGAEEPLSLSPREIECLNLIAKGKDCPAIARILGLSEYTVRDHIKSARQKLECNTIPQAIYEATRHRIINI